MRLSVLLAGTLIGWGVTGAICLWLLTTPRFDDCVRIDIIGEIQDVGTPLVLNDPVLDFGMRDEKVRFRVLGPVFAQALNKQVPRQLAPGAIASLTVVKSEYEDPFSPEPYRVPTVGVDAIRIDNVDILQLEDSRRWHMQNRRWAEILALVFAVYAAFSTAATIARLTVR